MSKVLLEKYNNINNNKLISILNKVEENPIFLDNYVKLLSEEEILTLNKELEIGIDYIVIVDCLDNNFLCYSISNDEFKMFNVDDNIFYDSKNIEKVLNLF